MSLEYDYRIARVSYHDKWMIVNFWSKLKCFLACHCYCYYYSLCFREATRISDSL